MKLLIPVLALFSFGQAWRNVTEEEVKTVFDGLLAEDNIVLKSKLYEIRLVAFSLGYLAGEVGDAVSLELMYTKDELLKQNGARLADGLKTDEDLQKREERILQERSTPPAYDGRLKNGRVIINRVVSQQTCGNCYLHTFVAALELAYARDTGDRIKFSEQEITDCYDRGCDGGDYRMVAITMSYLDKLSTRNSYVTGGYLNGQYTCRADTTPDALDKIKVVDYVEVTTETIEAAIVNYGSVMTCMRWSTVPGTDCYMTGYKEGVADFPEFPNGCDHSVLIVGYTPTYYIVRNSYGHSWGEHGYFRIKRGTNACGIEQQMAAVVVEPRVAAKAHNSNGCPHDKPNLCTKISTCIAGNRCVNAISKVERLVEREEAVVIKEEVEERVKKEDEEDEKRKENRVLEKSGVTAEGLKEYRRSSEGEEIELEKRCDDQHDACPLLKARGVCSNVKYAHMCLSTCDACDSAPLLIPPESVEQQGVCLKPTIDNGVVYMPGTTIMRPGQELKVTCNPGYTLVGEKVKCLIQNVFTNDDKDARLFPQCIKLDGNTMVGNGRTYLGTKNTYGIKDNNQCDSWNKDILRGVLSYVKDALKYKIGNHNYCRNPVGDQPVPFCLSSEKGFGKIVYCFKYPGCDVCGGVADQYGTEYCQNAAYAGRCAYSDINSRAQIDFFWENCKATCCATARC